MFASASLFVAPAGILAIYLATGAVAGLLSGLFGIGGGLVMVPALLVGFTLAGMPAEAIPSLALGTSLTAVCFSSALGSRENFLLGNLRQPFSRRTLILAAFLAGGVVAGAAVSTRLPRTTLLFLLGLYQIAVALWMASRLAHPALAGSDPALGAVAQDALPPTASAFMFLTGGVASIGGVGGATLMIPYFARVGVEHRQAAALSTWFGCVVGAFGFVSYGLLARPATALPWSLGYVSLSAFASLAAGSLFLVRFGARLANRLDRATLVRVFCAFLLVSGSKLLIAS